VEVENLLVELEIKDRDSRPLRLCIENRDTALFRSNPGYRRNCSKSEGNNWEITFFTYKLPTLTLWVKPKIKQPLYVCNPPSPSENPINQVNQSGSMILLCEE